MRDERIHADVVDQRRSAPRLEGEVVSVAARDVEAVLSGSEDGLDAFECLEAYDHLRSRTLWARPETEARGRERAKRRDAGLQCSNLLPDLAAPGKEHLPVAAAILQPRASLDLPTSQPKLEPGIVERIRRVIPVGPE